MITKILFIVASVLPLNPQITNANSICREKSKGISIGIPSNNIAVIFKQDGSKQCEEEETKIPPKIMREELEKLNIKVLKFSYGRLGRMRQMATCGQPTTKINIFYIPLESKEKALEQGYRDCFY